MLNLKKFKTKILKIKIKVTSFQTCLRPYVINTWFKFEDKTQNLSKVIVFTRNQTDDADDDGTKNNMSPPVRGRHNYRRAANKYTCHTSG